MGNTSSGGKSGGRLASVEKKGSKTTDGHRITLPVSVEKTEGGVETPAEESTGSPTPQLPPGETTPPGGSSELLPEDEEQQQVPKTLEASQTDDHREVYVVKHDYSTTRESELSIKKREFVKLLGRNEIGDWCEVCNDQGEVGWVPTSFIAKPDSLEKQAWYHGNITRAEAEQMLRELTDGCFLVRESQSKRGEYSISLLHQGHVFHYQINKDPTAGMYYISPNSPFQTLVELVAHHTKLADGLHTTLQHPVTDSHRHNR